MRLHQKSRRIDRMNQDLKDLIKAAEEKGYDLVKFEEYSAEEDSEVKTRWQLIFEKKK